MELLEREGFMQSLQEAYRTVLSGEGHCVFVTGEAGIGKSSLIRNFLQKNETTTSPLMALCDSLFTPRPLGVVYDLAIQIDPALADKISNATRRGELFADFWHALSKQPKPVIIIIEDIHWADEASLDFIKFLSRRINHTECLLILSYRDDEIGPFHPLRNVLGELLPGTFTRLQLEPFSKETVQRLASEKGYKEDMYSITGGNPFYVTEMLAGYRTDIPDSIRDAIMVLYNRCSENSRNIWHLLSVMPEGLELELLTEVDADWDEALEACLYHKIVLVQNNRLVFKHELFRKTIESFLSPFKRIEINKKVLSIFSEAFLKKNMIERVVHYAKNAAQNETVCQYAPLAAKNAALLGSHIESARLWLAAIEYGHQLEEAEKVNLYEQYTYECYLTNQLKEGIFYQSKVVKFRGTQADAVEWGKSLRFLSRLWWYDGHRTEAEDYAMRAIETFEALPLSKEKAMAWSNMAQLCMLKDDLEGCLEWGTKTIEMATALGDEEIRCHALNNVGTVRLKVPAMFEEGKTLLDESLQIAVSSCYHEHAARAYTNFVAAFVTMRDYANAEKYLEAGLEYCGQRDLHAWAWFMHAWKARILMETGNWDAAIPMAANQLSRSNQSGIIRLCGHLIVATVKIRRGEPGALELLQEAKLLAFQVKEHLRIVSVVIACLEYEWLLGERLLTKEEIDTTVDMMHKVNNRWLNSEADFWLKKVRNIDAGLVDIYEPYKLLKDGQVNKAAAVWKQKNCLYEAALFLYEGSETQKKEALVMLQTLGATATEQKLKTEMRSSGITRIPRGLRSSTKNNPAQLTTREMDILHLLKSGASNKDIASQLYISPKTVDNHISSILFKLDVSSRVKAVGEASKLGILK